MVLPSGLIATPVEPLTGKVAMMVLVAVSITDTAVPVMDVT